ncbi:hypothetical protein MMC13_008482 [Lambiella insularis]|nr:hypothetical protein [Lambiella insularis]
MRLNYNHLLMKSVAGYLVHPKIPVDTNGLRIADVGTGTAAWALETATKYPSATVDGFDISDEQFSPLYSISNVRLIVHDCFKPFPSAYLGQYDIVHARFWLCLVNNPDAPELLKNLITLLKPGGYLQWFDALALSTSVYKPDPAMLTPALEQHSKVWKKPYEYTSYDWVEQLPESFKSQALEVVAADRHVVGDEYRFIWGLSNLAGLEDLVDEKAIDTGKAEGIKMYAASLEAEMKKGAMLNTSFLCVVGRKGF